MRLLKAETRQMEGRVDQLPCFPSGCWTTFTVLTSVGSWWLAEFPRPQPCSVASCALRCRPRYVSSGTNCTGPRPPPWPWAACSQRPIHLCLQGDAFLLLLQSLQAGVWTLLAWVQRGESLKDFQAVLCRWSRAPCWLSLVPVCVESAHAHVRWQDHTCR